MKLIVVLGFLLITFLAAQPTNDAVVETVTIETTVISREKPPDAPRNDMAVIRYKVPTSCLKALEIAEEMALMVEEAWGKKLNPLERANLALDLKRKSDDYWHHADGCREKA